MIVFESVVKQFPDGTLAVSDLNVTIPKGQFVFIIGPSGAGKSTFMKLLTRELRPSKGVIRFGEFEVSKLSGGKVPALRRSMGIIFQDLKLIMDRTVFENVALTLEVHKAPKPEIIERVTRALERVNLSDKAQLFPIQLSGGEAQRTAFARATVHNPLAVLADEPTADLDPKNSDVLMELLVNLNKEGTTVVMATHNSAIVNALKKRVIVLEQGRIVMDKEDSAYAF